jgi:hypothetical protein
VARGNRVPRTGDDARPSRWESEARRGVFPVQTSEPACRRGGGFDDPGKQPVAAAHSSGGERMGARQGRRRLRRHGPAAHAVTAPPTATGTRTYSIGGSAQRTNPGRRARARVHAAVLTIFPWSARFLCTSAGGSGLVSQRVGKID